MPPRIALHVAQGNVGQAEFIFDERTTCIVGRSSDCSPQIPDDAEHNTISRHHFLLDINPPDIRIRDFGSLTGTYVNGQLIGKREKHHSPQEGAKLSLPEHDLRDGDEIRIGKTVFRVAIHVPATCAECGQELADGQAARVGDDGRCANCREKAVPTSPRPVPKRKQCAKCGRDVSAEVGEHRFGEYICAACKANPRDILLRLLGMAKSGRSDLSAIEGYVIERELGRGGFGAVYLARHEASGERVAMKVMLPQVAADGRATQMFLREIENTKSLRHDHVVRLRDAGCSDGTFFFTLEFCDSGSVHDLMKAHGGKLFLIEAGQIVLQVLDGLEYAHQANVPNVRMKDGSYKPGIGLVHRDLKPQNMFLCKSGRSHLAKVGDFGLSKAFDSAGLSGQTRTGSVAGTPLFMPRQQVVNFKYAKPDVDVWAAAASLYYMLTGQFPRDFRQDRDVWDTVLRTRAIPIRQRDPSVPQHLAEVIDRTLVDDPKIGFSTAAEFKRELEKVL